MMLGRNGSYALLDTEPRVSVLHGLDGDLAMLIQPIQGSCKRRMSKERRVLRRACMQRFDLVTLSWSTCNGCKFM